MIRHWRRLFEERTMLRSRNQRRRWLEYSARSELSSQDPLDLHQCIHPVRRSGLLPPAGHDELQASNFRAQVHEEPLFIKIGPGSQGSDDAASTHPFGVEFRSCHQFMGQGFGFREGSLAQDPDRGQGPVGRVADHGCEFSRPRVAQNLHSDSRARWWRGPSQGLSQD